MLISVLNISKKSQAIIIILQKSPNKENKQTVQLTGSSWKVSMNHKSNQEMLSHTVIIYIIYIIGRAHCLIHSVTHHLLGLLFPMKLEYFVFHTTFIY